MNQGDEADMYARKGKRKMNEDDAEPSIPSPEATAKQPSNVQSVINAVATMRPFSYGTFVPATELVSAPMRPFFYGSIVPVPEPVSAPMTLFSSGPFVTVPEPVSAAMRPFSYGFFLPASEPATIHLPSSLPPTVGQQIGQSIVSHNQNLRIGLYDTVIKKAEELAAKTIHEKEMEINAKIIENVQLEEKIAYYKGEIAQLLPHTRNWETTVEHLQRKLREVKENFPHLHTGEEETAESSHVDTGTVNPVRLDCVVCKKFVANIMIWRCRHVCVCWECVEDTEFCPVCGMPMTWAVEVRIPTYD